MRNVNPFKDVDHHLSLDFEWELNKVWIYNTTRIRIRSKLSFASYNTTEISQVRFNISWHLHKCHSSNGTNYTTHARITIGDRKLLFYFHILHRAFSSSERRRMWKYISICFPFNFYRKYNYNLYKNEKCTRFSCRKKRGNSAIFILRQLSYSVSL